MIKILETRLDYTKEISELHGGQYARGVNEVDEEIKGIEEDRIDPQSH